LKAARIIYPDAENHKQATLAAMLGIQVAREKAHSADGDLDVLMHLIKCLCRDADCDLDELLHIQNIPKKVTKIPFGKHKGKNLSDLPDDYVTWLLNKCDNLNPDLRASLLALR
jgi:exodeoxyribonuclease X